MDCHDAQRIISERLDGEPLESGLVEHAKEHCRSCPECVAYVRALVAVQRLPLPQPPADLADRVMVAVREEALRRTVVQTESEPPNPEAHVSTAVVQAGATPMGRLLTYAFEPRNRRTVALWATAAATLIIVSTVTAIGGIRQITTFSKGDAAQLAGESARTDLSALSATPDSGGSADDLGGAAVPEPSAAPPAIVVAGVVYQTTGVVAGVEPGSLSTVGSTTSSLDAGGTPAVRQVLGLPDPARVYVVNDAGELLGFDRVAREYRGRTYALSSGELPTYGLWPTLPSSAKQPSNPNGMPEYVSAGADVLGVEVYRPATGGTEAGFAIAPGTSVSDPAGGNPNWTWWVPIP